MKVADPQAPIPSFAQVTDSSAVRREHWAKIAGASVALHVLGIAILLPLLQSMPARTYRPPVREVRPQEVTKLIAPTEFLTQRAPNQREPAKEFNIASLPPRPEQQNTPAAPGAAAPPRPKFVVPKAAPSQSVPGPNLNVPEAPAIDVAQNRNQPAVIPPSLGTPDVPAPPPQVQEQEKPKLAFERPGAFNGRPTGASRIPLPRPTTTIDEAGRQAARRGGGGVIVGDEEPGSAPAPGSPAVPLPGKLGSSVELLTDTQGVDFWPYMLRVLSAVRRNWYAVIPESARLGRRGLVTVQFAISKDGSVRKVVFGQTSGAEALDRAAVAAISASNPFPPLPAEFRGSEVRLQFAFRYNLGAR